MTTRHALTASLVLALMATGAASAFEPVVSLPGGHLVINPPGGNIEVLATGEQTDGQFSVLVLNAKAGEGPGPSITHHIGADTYYVIEGTYEFHVGGKVFDGGPGTFVTVDAGHPYGFIAKTDGKILIVFQPAGYERFFLDWNDSQTPIGPDVAKLEEKYGMTRP